MSHLIDMMLKYPSIIPINLQSTEFQGYLPVNGIDYEILIKQEDEQPTVTLNSQLQPFEEQICLLQTSKCSNIVSFLDHLKQIISSKTSTKSCKNLSETYRHILTEYVELREFYIGMYRCSISQDLSDIKISHLDESNRVHDMLVHTNCNNTEGAFQVVQHPFPENHDKLFQNYSSLKIVYEKFVQIIEKLQNFFDVMDSLDGNCWILDPEKPCRKDCYRRIGLDQNVSMIITVDPWNDASIPDIKFLGAERVVENFRQKVAENLIDWKPDGDIIQEILKLLGISSFPTRPIQTATEGILLCNAGECCICFSSRLNGLLPEIMCQNTSCEQYFHKECLYQWLISVNAKQSFNELYGQCPNCEKQISCPV